MPQELRPDVILAYKKYERLWALFSKIVLTLSPSSKLSSSAWSSALEEISRQEAGPEGQWKVHG